MKAFHLASLLLLILLPGNGLANDTSDVCRFFPNNQKIRDPDSCNRYITCVDHVSKYTNCGWSTPFFDKDSNKCVKTLNDRTTCSIECNEHVGKFVSDPKSCRGYYYCQDKAFALFGQCPTGTHFNGAQQKCIYLDESDCHMEQFSFCSIVKDGVNIKDEKHCGKYYTCKKGQLQSKECKGKYYNAADGTCVQKSQVDCPAHPIPKGACGTAKRPKNNKKVSDDASCRGYFYCAAQKSGLNDTNPVWYQCPPDTFFHAKSETCMHPLNVVCSEDRCDGRTLPFVVSGTKGCRNYLRCVDGKTSDSELSCNNKFFDEKMGACISSPVVETACDS